MFRAVAIASTSGGAFGFEPLVWAGIWLSVFQQFVGINVIFYYSTTLWKSVGFQEPDSFLISVITSVTNIVATIIAIALIAVVGRKALLIAGSVLMTANEFVIGFGTSWGPVVCVLLGEMFPNTIRALALGVGAATQWGANFVVSATFPVLAEAGLQVAYGRYAAFALLSLLFVLRFVRETKGKEAYSKRGLRYFPRCFRRPG